MICRCGTTLKVKNSYQAGRSKTQRLECPACLTVYTSATILVAENPARGEGAYKLAQRLRQGEEIQWPPATKS